MKFDPRSLLLGALLGALAILTMGQTKVSPSATIGRYQATTSYGGGIFVTDTTTGSTKFLSSLENSTNPAPLKFGVPFERLPPADQR